MNTSGVFLGFLRVYIIDTIFFKKKIKIILNGLKSI